MIIFQHKTQNLKKITNKNKIIGIQQSLKQNVWCIGTIINILSNMQVGKYVEQVHIGTMINIFNNMFSNRCLKKFNKKFLSIKKSK